MCWNIQVIIHCWKYDLKQVFLVADAIPRDDRWLVSLVSAVQGAGVAGAYSRQLPRPEHDLLARSRVEDWPTNGTRSPAVTSVGARTRYTPAPPWARVAVK